MEFRPNLSLFCVIVFLCGSAVSLADGQKRTPLPNAVTVFQANGDGYPCIRIPSLVHMSMSNSSDGVYLAFAECRGFTGDGCEPSSKEEISGAFGQNRTICLRRSFDGGKTWEAYQRNITGGMCADPSAVVLSTPGHVILQCDDTTYYPAPNGTIWQVASTDYGATWQPRMNVSQEIGLRGIHLGTAGAGVVKSLPAGGSRILFAAYYKPAADMVTLIWYSDDNGTTYHLTKNAVPFCSEPQLILSPAPYHDVLLVCRNNVHYNGRNRRIARSMDAGITFSDPANVPSLPDPACQGPAVTLTNGSICSSGPGSAYNRVNMTLLCTAHGLNGPFAPVAALGGVEDGAAYRALALGPNGQLGALWETSSPSGCTGPSCRIQFTPVPPLK